MIKTIAFNIMAIANPIKNPTMIEMSTAERTSPIANPTSDPSNRNPR
jgi:hypothetical protein